MIQVVVISNPFQPFKDLRRTFGVEGQTIREWLATAFGPDFQEFEQPTICQLNGQPILRKFWDTRKLKDEDVLAFVTVPQGIETLIIAIVAIAVAVVAVTLMPDPKIPQDQTASPDSVYTLRGQTNRFRPNEPVEVVYGKCRIWPTFITRPYSEYRGNDQYQYSLFCLGQGRFEIHDMKLDDTPVEDFEEVQLNVVAPGGDLELVHSNVVTAAEVNNLELYGPNEEEYTGWSGPFTLNEWDNPIKRIGIDVSFPQGLYRMDSKGKLQSQEVEVEFQYREIGEMGGAIGDWTEIVNPTITRSDNTPQRITFNHGVPSGRYEVRGRRVSEKSESIKVSSQVRWEAVKGYARLHNNFGEVTLVEMVALATNNLNDNTSKAFNLKVTRKLRTWDPVDGWSAGRVATRNPAWAFCDLFRAEYGAKLSGEFLDKQALYDLSLIFEAKNQWFDWVFDQPMTVWDAAKMIMRVGRCVPIPQGSLVTAVRDKAQTLPSAVFNQHNIVKGTLVEKLRMFEFQPFDGIIVEYTDNDTWKPREVTCILPGRDGLNLDRIKFPGCTNRNKAYQEGMYTLSRREYQRTTVTFQTGLEGHLPSYLDLISITHDTIRVGQGGMIMAYNSSTNVMTLSEEVVFATDNIVHKLAIRGDDGAILGSPITVTRGSAPNKVVLASDPPVALDFSSDRVPPLYAFGVADLWSFLGKVVSIKPMDEKTVEITCVNYVPKSYDWEDATTVEAIPVQVIRNRTNPTVASITISAVPDSEDKIFVDWPPLPGAASYILQTSYDDGLTWNPVGNYAVPPVQLSVNPGPVKVRVAPFALNGNVIYTVSNEFIVGSNIAVPAAVVYLDPQPAFTGLTCTTKWSAVTGAMGYNAEVYLSDGTTLLRLVELGTALQFNYTHDDFLEDQPSGDARVFKVKVKAYNAGGESLSAEITRTNPAPVAPTAVTIGTPVGAVYPVTWTHTPEDDFLEYRVYASTSAGFTPGPSNLVDTVAASPGHVTTAGVNMYVRVAAVDVWGSELALSDEVPIVVVTLPAWQTAAHDYFLTSAWGTTTGDVNTGNVNAWVGAKGVMSSTRSANDAVRTGPGTGRRCIQPKGNLQLTSHPTGLVGIIFAFRRTNTNFCRFINYGNYTQGWYVLSPGSSPALDGYGGGSAGTSTVLAAETGPTYAWHSFGVKYDTVTSTIPKVWIDGTLLTASKTVVAAVHAIMKRFGDSGSYDDFELGDFAIYTAPSDSDMASYGAAIAAKWQAP